MFIAVAEVISVIDTLAAHPLPLVLLTCPPVPAVKVTVPPVRTANLTYTVTLAVSVPALYELPPVWVDP